MPIDDTTPEEASGRFKAFSHLFCSEKLLGTLKCSLPLSLLLLAKCECSNQSETSLRKESLSTFPSQSGASTRI